jgi:hypothetical protein
MSKALFDRLINHAALQGLSIGHAGAVRFIRRKNMEDAELMARAEVSVLVVTRQIRLIRMEWGDELYFCAFGLAEPEQLLNGLEIIDLTPGTFALGILQADIRPLGTVTGSEIRDIVEDNFMGEGSDYDGHELNLITPLFPRAVLYRATAPLSYLQDIHRVLGLLLAKTYLDGPVQLAPTTIENLSDLFEDGTRHIPYRNLVQGILAISWENLFVEMYRCLEQLYAGPRIKALRQDWKSVRPLRELAVLLERTLSWRPKEDEALRHVIECCDEATIYSVCTSLRSAAPSDTHSRRCESAARLIYELRNRIVHYRPIHDSIEFSDDEWNSVIGAMIELVREVYDQQGEDFFEAVGP